MSKIHALIVDDNSKNVSVLSKLMAMEGAVSTEVIDPRRLGTLLQNVGNVDVIFLDLEMPKRDGYEILEILKLYIQPTVPIVACTVHTAEIQHTRKLGFFSFVAKPLDMDRFSNQLNRILSGEPVWEAR